MTGPEQKLLPLQFEEWRSIISGWPHEVSSLGRVRGPRGLIQPQGDTHGYLKVKLRHKGLTLQVKLHRLVVHAFYPYGSGKPKPGRARFSASTVARLLGHLHLPPRVEGWAVICHKNGKPDDNRASNLMVGTDAMNAAHTRQCPFVMQLKQQQRREEKAVEAAVRALTRVAKPRVGQPGEKNNAGHKLTAADVRRIKRGSAHATDIARKLGVSESLVSSIRRGLKWKHIS